MAQDELLSDDLQQGPEAEDEASPVAPASEDAHWPFQGGFTPQNFVAHSIGAFWQKFDDSLKNEPKDELNWEIDPLWVPPGIQDELKDEPKTER